MLFKIVDGKIVELNGGVIPESANPLYVAGYSGQIAPVEFDEIIITIIGGRVDIEISDGDELIGHSSRSISDCMDAIKESNREEAIFGSIRRLLAEISHRQA